MTLAKVSPGQPLRLTAEAFNAFVDAANGYQASQRSRSSEAGGVVPVSGTIMVRNDTGAPLERYAPVGLGAPLILPGDNLRSFQERVVVSGAVPMDDQPFAVLQVPLAAGALGEALITGATPALVAVVDAADTTAGIISGVLTSGSGPATIVWKNPGTGPQWAILRLGGGGVDRLDQLADVAVDAPTQGQTLVYDATEEVWKAGSPEGLPAGNHLDTLRLVNGAPTFQAFLSWGQIAVRSPSHSTTGAGEPTWVTPTTDDGKLFDPAVADDGGYGSTLGFYGSTADGIDIGIEKNVGADVPGMHNPDDLEIHFRLAPREGPGVLGVASGTAVPSMTLITTPLLADGAVTDAKIVSLAWGKLTGVPSSFPVASHTHTLGGDLSGTTTNAQIVPGAVSATELAANAVTAGAIAPGAVGSSALANGAVTQAKITAGAVGSSQLAANAVGAAQIAPGAVGSSQLAANAVGTAQVADGAITNAKLQNDSLTIGGTAYHLGDTVTNLLANPMTAAGDLIVGGTAGAPTRLPGNAGGTLQVLASKNGITQLLAHTLDQMEDVTVASPADKEVLTYDAAAGQWKNAAPPASGGGSGHGQHPAMVGKVGGKTAGNAYVLTLYPEYPSLAVAWVTTGTQLQGDATKTIPANTMTIACGVLKAGQAGTSVAHYDFFIQVPVWM